jgi:Spy/CpxP family protein refolding chaperone
MAVVLAVWPAAGELQAQTAAPPTAAPPRVEAPPQERQTGRVTPPQQGRQGLRQGRQNPPRGRAGEANPDGPLTVPQVEQMFDNYAVVQAQAELALTDDQLARFTRRFQALQNVRRRAQRERQMKLRELGALIAGAGPVADPNAVNAKVKELDDLIVQAAQEVRTSYGAIDEVLSPKQRAHFRTFEFRMERKKLELLARAQAAARGGRQELR